MSIMDCQKAEQEYFEKADCAYKSIAAELLGIRSLSRSLNKILATTIKTKL